jgi:tRNA(fMet)-specific endonuclease VapC
MRLALDTNRYTDFQRGDPAVTAVLEAADEIILPFAAVAELRVGFLGGSRGGENEQSFQAFLARPGVTIVYPNQQTTLEYATLYHQLRKQGTPIPTNDIWIAAIVVQNGLTLYSRDAHFDHLPQIPRA